MNKVLRRVFIKKQKEYNNLLRLLNGNGKKKLSGEGLNNSKDLVSYLSAEGLSETGTNSIGVLISNIQRALKVVETTDGKCPFCHKQIAPTLVKQNNIPTCIDHARKRVENNVSIEDFYQQMGEKIGIKL